jgi:hypothetical protein
VASGEKAETLTPRHSPLETLLCPICGRRPAETINGDLQYQFVCRLVGESGMHLASGDGSSDRNEAIAMWNAYTEELFHVLWAHRHGANGMG